MNDFQFYPTPVDLARLAWGKFKNREFTRLLEPSAGNGDLILANPKALDYYGNLKMPIDACEIDISKHPLLRKHKINVVGIDFLALQSGTIYSHFLLNPPFSNGVVHVLKAWDLAWDAEIVAIINAETVRNPFSKERQRLVKLIEEHGEVEFIANAFRGEAVERETDVEIALVYLKKEACIENDIFGGLLDDLSIDGETGAGLAGDYAEAHEVALPRSEIENLVACFGAAVSSMREVVFAEAKANHYSALLGKTMADHMAAKNTVSRHYTTKHVQCAIAERYNDLKDRAWASILRSSNVTSRLSSKAHQRVEAEFEHIKKLDFTVQNIYGFLLGIVENQGKIQIEMACDVFDLVTAYHTDNTTFYRGWKSNDKHRTCGMKIKTTRFVLPRNPAFCHSLDWDAMQRLRDIDKVFAMLDSKATPEVSLEYLFSNNLNELKRGARLSGSYFDVRYYPGAETIHFFARDKKLIDRFNRLVGRHRQWLPPEGARVSDSFWLQYDKSETMDKEVRTENAKGGSNYWRDPLYGLFTKDEEEAARASARLDAALNVVQERHGINVDFLLGDQEQQLLLIAA